MNGEEGSVFKPHILCKRIDLVYRFSRYKKSSQLWLGEINELTNQCIVVLSSGGVQCWPIPLKTINTRFKAQILYSVLVLHSNNNMTNNFDLDSRLGQLEEQGNTMAQATRHLLDTVYTIKDTVELLRQMNENHQRMLEMSRRVETLMNDAKMEIKRETIQRLPQDLHCL